MSRVGLKPIEIPEGVEVKIDGSLIAVKGPKGELKQEMNPSVFVNIGEEDGKKVISVSVENNDQKFSKAIWGTMRALINNMVVGVTEGFSKSLEIVGVGYRVNQQGSKLVFEVGFSHPVEFALPEGISAAVDKNVVTISGTDKQLVGETAARIRKIRKPEPYKGKGIRYVDEVVRRKVGKAAKTAG